MTGFLSAVVGGVLVLSLVTPLFAAEITVGGYNRIRYRNEENRQVDQTRESDSNKRHYIDHRTQIHVGANLAEGLSGRIDTEYFQDFGTNNPFGGSAGPVGIVQAWVQAKVPGTPVTIRLGRDTSLGVAHGYTVGASTYGTDQVRLGFPVGPAEFWLFYAVASRGENARFTHDDTDIAGVTIPITVGPGVVVNPYAMFHHVGGGSNCPVPPCPGTGSSPTSDNDTTEKRQYIVGASIDLKQGPFSAWLEGAYNGGTAREAGFTGSSTFFTQVDRQAYFVASGADFSEGIFKAGLQAGLSSGDKDGFSDGTASNFDAPLHSNPITFIHDVIAAPGPGTLGNNTTRVALGLNGITTTDESATCPAAVCGSALTFSPGLWFVKAELQAKPQPEWTYNVAATYLQATSVPGGAGRGIGTELYANVAWQMYKNFSMTTRAGYMFAGPFFTRRDRADGDPDNPFLWRIYGILSF